MGSGIVNATSISKPIDPVYPEVLMQMKAADFIKLTVNDFAKLSQKKLTLKEKIAFSVLKKNLRRELKKNPNLTVGEYMLAAGNKKISTVGWIAIAVGFILITLIIIAAASDGWLL